MGGDKQQIAVYDEARLVGEREAYQNWLDRRAEEVYRIATSAKARP